jgi:hypothetical protein
MMRVQTLPVGPERGEASHLPLQLFVRHIAYRKSPLLFGYLPRGFARADWRIAVLSMKVFSSWL